MWNWQSGSPCCPRQWEERHAPRRRETQEVFISLIWNVSRLGRVVFVFCHRGCHTHTPTVCSDNSVRWDRRIQVPHKHILLTAGTWSSLSHDSALTREEQTETWTHTHDCSKAGRGRLLHLSVNYSKGKAQHAFLVIKQQERVEAVCCSLTVVQFPQNKLEFPRGMLGNAK